ncbi:hypothetical protein [Thermococcus henrietii]|uniref:hypothetical protein n=1 Tax=Thermococcus henrietii TaxID=2016361 RepID=UPI0011AB5CE7|nr:hypothetical protein [Thermococcus henrietii]
MPKMDGATFMERYGYGILLAVAVIVIVVVLASVFALITGVVAEFGTAFAVIVLVGVLLYVLMSRRKAVDVNAEERRKIYERGEKPL